MRALLQRLRGRLGAGIWAVVVAACLLPSAAQAQRPKPGAPQREAARDPRVWTIVKVEDSYVLRYGAARAADPSFAAACQPSARLLQLTVEVVSARIRSGDGVALSLAAGRRRLDLAGSAFRASTEGRMVVEAAVVLDARMLELFADGDTLTVRVPGATEAYPLAGARPRLADFRRVCLPGG